MYAIRHRHSRRIWSFRKPRTRRTIRLATSFGIRGKEPPKLVRLLKRTTISSKNGAQPKPKLWSVLLAGTRRMFSRKLVSRVTRLHRNGGRAYGRLQIEHRLVSDARVTTSCSPLSSSWGAARHLFFAAAFCPLFRAPLRFLTIQLDR